MYKNEKRALTSKIIVLAGSFMLTGMAAASVDRTTTYTYTGLGLVASIDGPRTDVPDVTSFGYDAQGNRTSTTNALGHVTQITAHDASGRPLTIIDPNGVITQLTYDARGRLLTRTTDGQTTTMEYDGVGNVTRITQPDGSYINYEYDPAHRLIGISDILGNRIQYTLDNAGNRTQEQVFDPASQLTRTHSSVFDELSRMIQDIGAANQTSTFGYDPNGNQTGSTDANSNSTTQAFDALNRLTGTTDAHNGDTLYTYDAQDNLTSVTDPRGNITSYQYDGLGNLISQISPDTGTTTFTYDEAGNRLSSTDARGITANYNYDELNRVIGIQYPSDSSQDISYSYDEIDVTNGIGRLTRVVDASGTTRYHYDKRGNTTKVVTTLGGHTKTTQYAYDAADGLIRIIYPSGQVVDYTDSNSDNKIDRVSLDDQGNITVLADNIEYLPFGARTNLLFGNGLTQTSTHDLDNRIESLTLPSSGPDTDGDGIADGSDNCIQVANPNQIDTDTDGFGNFCDPDYNNDGYINFIDLGILKGSFFSTDANLDLNGDGFVNFIDLGIMKSMFFLSPGPSGQGAAVAENETWHYGLDAAGNITSRGTDPLNASHTFNYDELHRLINEINPDNTDSYSYDANGNRTDFTRDGDTTGYLIFTNNNQIDQVGSDQRTYDAAGNTISDRNGTRTFSYNQAGRISEVHENSQLLASYTYNAHGQRTIKVTPNGTSYYLYDISGKLLGEYDDACLPIKEYVHLEGEPIAQLEASKITYLHTDHLATPRKGTNQAGELVWQWESEAFGNALPQSSDGTIVNLRFPGQYYDAETGFYYNYYRTYDPSTGRYLESDPIGLDGGLNTYAYVDGNPLSYIDPYGLSKFDKTFGLPKKFWRWYHRNHKREGDGDFDKDEARELYDEWKDMGKPGPDSKDKWKDIKDWIIPFPIQMACEADPCNPMCKDIGYVCPNDLICEI